jgi:hypothetical protein
MKLTIRLSKRRAEYLKHHLEVEHKKITKGKIKLYK